ncbi:MAG: DUF5678 domain-containing protein [Candidatus Micrarchaeota archaeon]
MGKAYSAFMNLDVGPYIGEWIAMVDNKILAHGKSAKKTYFEAKKKTNKEIFLAMVPKNQAMIL